jgi:hypothetical protein
MLRVATGDTHDGAIVPGMERRFAVSEDRASSAMHTSMTSYALVDSAAGRGTPLQRSLVPQDLPFNSRSLNYSLSFVARADAFEPSDIVRTNVAVAAARRRNPRSHQRIHFVECCRDALRITVLPLRAVLSAICAVG